MRKQRLAAGRLTGYIQQNPTQSRGKRTKSYSGGKIACEEQPDLTSREGYELESSADAIIQSRDFWRKGMVLCGV